MTDTELLIRDTLTTYADEAEITDLVAAAKAQSRQLQRSAQSRRGATWLRGGWTPRRVAVLAAAAVVVFVAVAIAVGGGSTNAPFGVNRKATITSGGPTHLKSQADRLTRQRVNAPPRAVHGALRVPRPIPSAAPTGAAGTKQVARGFAPLASGSDGALEFAPEQQPQSRPRDNGLGATYVVKTGEVDITVEKGSVPATISSLIQTGKHLGGYVSSSTSDTVTGGVAGQVVLRVPVGKFEDAVTAAQKLGKVTYQTTDAQDVTGKVVDLGARLNTLRHSRSTYLTILSRANTIGETLSVQQRVDDIQSQIERLQGKLKVLRNQSADSTLTVAVSEPGTDDSTVVTPDQRTGINKAWHTSVSRFNHGVNAIVGALGPLLLALILIGLAFVIVKVAMRRSRRAA